jgi:hypothetical protein
MTTGATGQLGLALPVQGELSGTWGDTVNNGITQYTNIAIAGTLTLTGDGAVSLVNTTGDASASNITSILSGAGTVTAQFAAVQISGTTGTKTVTFGSAGSAPYSKTYVVDNASSYSVTFKAYGQTGVSIAAAEKCTVFYNGTDIVKVASSVADGVTSVSGTGTVNGITLTGTVTSTGSLTLGGTLSNVNLASQVTGTLPIANGGTGQTTASAAFNGLSPITTTGDLIIGNGSNSATRLPIGADTYVLTSNGTTASWAASSGGVTSFSAGTTGLTPSTGTTGAVTLAGTLDVDNGGTGQTSYTNGQLLIGNTTGNTLTKATLTAGTGINITNGSGSITIATSGGNSSTGANLYMAVNFGGF